MSTPVALRVVEANARTYRRVWKGSIVTTFLSPVLFLAAMGLGLGSLVNRGTSIDSLGGFSYIAFLAPGLLAATAMQTGAGESSWPVMAGIKWIRTFHATLATPIGVEDLVIGFLIWIGIRLLIVSIGFVAVMAAFGAVSFVDGLRAVPAALLTGLAFAAPVMAFTASLDKESGLATLFRFGIIPMFLLSGTFFPVSQLPGWLQPFAYATPLWHGVDLARGLALRIPYSIPVAVHVAYLLVWLGVGTALAVRALRQRLQP